MFFGLSTLLFPDIRILGPKHLRAIKESGFDTLELVPFHDISPDTLSMLKRLDMNIYSMHGDYLNTDISSPDEDYRKKSVNNIKGSIKKSKSLGIKVIVVHPGAWVPERRGRVSRLENSIKSLTDIVGFASVSGIKIALENLPPEFLCDSPGELKYVLESVRNIISGNGSSTLPDMVGICIDTGHANLAGTLSELIHIFSADILSMHLHDNAGDTGKDRAMALDDLHYLPGHGNINWDRLFNSLNDIDYKDALIFEVLPGDSNTRDEKHLLEDLRVFTERMNHFLQSRPDKPVLL